MKLLFILLSTISFHATALINGKPINTDIPLVQIHFANNSHICSGIFIENQSLIKHSNLIAFLLLD